MKRKQYNAPHIQVLHLCTEGSMLAAVSGGVSTNDYSSDGSHTFDEKINYSDRSDTDDIIDLD